MLGSNAASARKLKKTSTIAIMPVVCDDIGSLLLSSSERAVLDILLKASSRLHDAQVFDLKQMSKAFKHYSSGYKLLETFDNACSMNSMTYMPSSLWDCSAICSVGWVLRSPSSWR